MTLTTIPGYPRIGTRRALKRALEGYWPGRRTAGELDATAAEIRAASWARQAELGLDLLPVNDFSLYDQVLDTTILLGAIPARFAGLSGHDLHFAMARGTAGDDGLAALELTKWFDTNYHYLVPELEPGQSFTLADDKPLRELAEARAQGHGDRVRVSLVGPLTWLLLAKRTDGGSTLELLDGALPVYEDLTRQLAAAGAPWLSFEEPVLAGDRTADEMAALATIYGRLAAAAGDAKVLVQVPFGDPGDALGILADLPLAGIGLDLVRAPALADRIARDGLSGRAAVFAGVVDGRNVWTNDLYRSLATLRGLRQALGAERVHVSSSCSLLHVPLDAALETDIAAEVRPWLAFADQKLAELATLGRALASEDIVPAARVAAALDANRRVIAAAAASPLRRDPAVRERLDGLPADIDRRPAPYAARLGAQREALPLPAFPTTTIGSFPQTPGIRAQRRRMDTGEISAAEYDAFLEAEIREVIHRQEEVGLDVLVHGEPERNDMVQYFGERLDGFAFTREGWVQSYGSRCVRPPIIYGDVARPAPMTVRWATFAQAQTDRPVKGMLTGPVTILNWSFVRDDQPRGDTCLQIALAIRDEVADLESAGIGVIQVDEPALREGLPLRRADRDAYLDWATRCFRVAAGVAAPATQIHTHMCYSEFAEIIDAIEALDADVLSIEHARSGQELLEVFERHGYDKGIGPGVYDIHSPAIPGTAALTERLRAITAVLAPEQVWVNPDCGLKTRRVEEVWPALRHMVDAARALRQDAQVPAAD